MKAILTLDEIKNFVNIPQLILAIERGFVSYSRGQSVVPPVGFLHFDEPPGDVHIKYGYRLQDEYYVLKVASAFYNNAELGLPVNDGVVLVFNSHTGGIEFIFLDEGWLTDIRTAAAGAVAAKHLANKSIDTIGIVGTGVQARLQLELLRDVIDCQRCVVWGRDFSKAEQMIFELKQIPAIQEWGIEIIQTDNLESLTAQSRLIVTTTSARAPLITAKMIRSGTHITAVGSDDHGKQELSSDLLAKADKVIADSISQCVDHGECHTAIRDKQINESSLLEMGHIISHSDRGRTHENQITIADLTGVAVQDIQIANMVAKAYLHQNDAGTSS